MKSFRSAFVLAVIPVCVGQTLAGEHTKDSLETITKALAKKSAIVLDVRERDEWDEGHLKGARFIPLSELKKGVEREALLKRLQLADKDKKPSNEAIIYVHCASGGRCLPAAEILKKQGFDARPLKHGYDELVKAGFPEADPKTPDEAPKSK